jgi:hypothetical protein
MAIGDWKIFQNKIVQIIIAVAIPNIGGFLTFLLFANAIAENENRDRLEPSYGPPDYVSVTHEKKILEYV